VTTVRAVPVVVAGGGPGGSAAALALAHGGRRVLLADASPPGAFRIGEALPPAARPLLRDLGVLDAFLSDGHHPCYGNMSAWGSRVLRTTEFVFDPHGHGWHLDRARFDAGLRAAAADAGVEVWTGTRLTVHGRDAGGWDVRLESPDGAEDLRCGWLVDATGRSAAVARRAGAARVRGDALVAFAARFRAPSPAGDEDGRTMVEAAPDAWWYTARLPSAERMVAYFTDADLADRAALLAPEGFAAALRASEHVRAAVQGRGYALHGRPWGADAGSARLDRVVGDGWVAVGDAALSFDPLSSQGMLNALYTGLRAGQALDAALAGDEKPLDAYARRLDEVYRAYRRHHAVHYADERRWTERPFWSRRRVEVPEPVQTAGAAG
jgi:flavin-dependent dehydrogenase